MKEIDCLDINRAAVIVKLKKPLIGGLCSVV
jgi:hypothetical protein